MNGASKYSAISTARLNRSKCSGHGSSIPTLPIGDPMQITPIPLSAIFVLISSRRAGVEVHDVLAVDAAELEMGDAVVPADADLVVEVGPKSRRRTRRA